MTNHPDDHVRPLPPPAYPPPPAYGPPQPYGAPGYPTPRPSSGLYTAAAIVNWVVLGLVVVSTCGIGLVAAAWFVPMTINIHKGVTDGRRHTALAVCTLIFCNLVSGILMLVEDGNRPG